MSVQLILDQIITNVRDAISTVSPMDVMVNDKWESIPYTYDSNTGVFKFEFQGITFECKVNLEAVSKDQNVQHWDKIRTNELVSLGLSWDHARIAVGIIAEERMNADVDGYTRGFNDGAQHEKERQERIQSGVTGIDRVAE